MTTESNEISLHQIKIYLAVKGAGAWVTSNEVATQTGVAPRTVRSHMVRLVGLGVFDQAEVFPGHRYRLSDLAGKRNKAYCLRLDSAAEAFGIKTC